MFASRLASTPVATAARSRDYKVYTLQNFKQIPQIRRLDDDQIRAIEIVGRVLPFRVNNYVIEELIDWERVPDDPIFRITFPQKGMLRPEHFQMMEQVIKHNGSRAAIRATADRIRWQLNPHPAGQIEHNVPRLDGQRLHGMQHKYPETVLFFPAQGQTCHAYCTFCFRWAQFVGMKDLRFAMREAELLVKYVSQHPEISDILFTGGDPMVMKAHALRAYVEPLLKAKPPHLKTIRFGTKSLSYWPYRYTSDPDADDILRLFEEIRATGLHVSIMAHFNHPHEMRTEAALQAIRRIQETGAQIRTQSPLLQHINDDADVWATMWREQVNLGMIPYYMFVVRDTGAQHYFGVPLVRAWRIFRDAYNQVSGLARTVRGPSMSAHPGKVEVVGVSEIKGERVMVLRFLQGRNPDWVERPFFATYDEKAIWLDELRPAFGEEKFFFEREPAPLSHAVSAPAAPAPAIFAN
ncbi:MAG: lysine 2,3-aminomutase [Chloroflexi bacterium]|nr:lysine 2,3-aminomutase [Chloroflexota bacterium]